MLAFNFFGATEGGLFDINATLPLMAIQVVALTYILNSLFFKPVGNVVEKREKIVSNWGGALIPWRLIKLPSGELGAPTADINTTIALALLVSLSYFYAGLSNKGWRYFEYYVHPTPIMLPFKILEDFTKPLSLSFRLFGNILADELVVGVLVFLVPLILPIPVMFLGLFTSAIQALIFATLAAYYIGEAVEEHH